MDIMEQWTANGAMVVDESGNWVAECKTHEIASLIVKMRECFQKEEFTKAAMNPNAIWLMFTEDGFYPIEPSPLCKAEDHGKLNSHVIRIENLAEEILWERDPS